MVQVAIADLAGLPVVNSVAVAQIQAVARAKAPDGILHEPRKHLRECAIQCARINAIRHGSNDFGATATAMLGKRQGQRGFAVPEVVVSSG